jgi:hypothetical protein
VRKPKAAETKSVTIKTIGILLVSFDFSLGIRLVFC